MQTSNRILDDLARVAGGAASAMSGIKDEIESLVRQQLDRLLSEAELVRRDEFEAIKAVAVKARAEQEKLEKRVHELESALKKGAKTTKGRTAKP
ncbi:MAG: accessory factor UbiK family protein [Rhodospirillales bacterium]|nr:accessory factor UbiK family protein [Rhodospirillales bacterium]